MARIIINNTYEAKVYMTGHSNLEILLDEPNDEFRLFYIAWLESNNRKEFAKSVVITLDDETKMTFFGCFPTMLTDRVKVNDNLKHFKIHYDYYKNNI